MIDANHATRYEGYAADKAGDPHALENNGIASGSENEDACRAAPPLPPLPVSWQSSLTRYNTNNNSWLVAIDRGRCDYNSFQRRNNHNPNFFLRSKYEFYFGNT